MSEEKKLTDEEIIKAAEYCQKIGHYSRENCKGCSYYKKSCTDLPKDILDLLHRLQSEKAKPKSKKILANRVYSDATLKKWKKEDLIEQIRILEHNWATAEEALNNSAKNSEKIISEQKAEIERLTGVVNRLEMADKCGRLMRTVDQKEIAELQKQVDEYKAKIEQGTLIELPCKVGDTVYIDERTWTWYNSCFNRAYIGGEFFVVGKITSIRFTDKSILIKVKATYRENQRLYKKKDYPIGAIGKTIFLTREESEKRLKELQNG